MHCHFCSSNVTSINRNYNDIEVDIKFCIFSNELLLKSGFKKPKETKTGTTIVGIIYKDGVVLGADTRATAGPIVQDKNCEKIHFLAKNI